MLFKNRGFTVYIFVKMQVALTSRFIGWLAWKCLSAFTADTTSCSWMSLGMIVTRIGVDGAQVGVLKQTDQITLARLLQNHWKRRSVLKSCAISRTRRWKDSLQISSSVDFW